MISTLIRTNNHFSQSFFPKCADCSMDRRGTNVELMPCLMEFILIFNVIQCSCLIAPLRGYMKRHCEEHRYPFQTSPIGYYAALFHVVTYMFSQYDQSRPLSNSLGPVGMTTPCTYILLVKYFIASLLFDLWVNSQQLTC